MAATEGRDPYDDYLKIKNRLISILLCYNMIIEIGNFKGEIK